MSEKPRVCKLCPKDISHKSKTADYCKSCRIIRDRQFIREANRKSRGYYDKKICESCGEVWERGNDKVKRWTGICSKCRDENYRKRRKCVDCDEMLEKGTKKQRCDDCNVLHRKNYNHDWRIRKKVVNE